MKKGTHKNLIDELDSEIMEWVYEVVKINFGATLVQDSTELRAILSHALDKQKEQLEKERWWSECIGCKEGHSSFWKTVMESTQWQLWRKEQSRRFSLMAKKELPNNVGVYDMPEVEECGWIGKQHFQDFISFVLKNKKI